MSRKFLVLFLSVLFAGLASPIFALENVKLGTSVKMHAPYYLVVLAAEEKGFWKDNGLEVEWIPFAGTAPHMHAVAAGATNIDMSASALPMQAAERGLPVVMVAEHIVSEPFFIWVRADSPYRHVRDLKTARIGVTTMGGLAHVYARIVVAAQGIEKDVRFVGAGGIPQQVAGIRVGAFEAVSLPLATLVDLKQTGVVREIASTDDYLPKPWFERVVLIRKDFGRNKPDVVRKGIKATLQTIDFIKKNRQWAIDKMKSFQGLSEDAAKLVYNDLSFSATGRLDRKAVENVRRVYIETGILTEKTPAVDELFTNEYLP